MPPNQASLNKKDYTLGIGILLIVVLLWTSSNFVTQVSDGQMPQAMGLNTCSEHLRRRIRKTIPVRSYLAALLVSAYHAETYA